MSRAASSFAWESNTGRDGWDEPETIPADMSAESLNISIGKGQIGTRRSGLTASGAISGSKPSTAPLVIFPFAPSGIGNTTYLVVHDGTNLYVFTISTTFATVSSANLGATPQPTDASQFNNKLYLAMGAGNRPRILDASLSLRLIGVSPSGAPTVANNGVGAYAAIPRWYRQRYRVKSGATILRQGEASSAVAFTPSGAGLSARVTKAAAISEGETHWVLEASAQSSSGPWYEIAETVVGTATYDDTAAPSTYSSTGTLAPLDGAYTVPPNAKLIQNDGERVYFTGADTVGIVYFTPVINATTTGDDERVQFTATQDDFIVLGANVGYTDTALRGPVNGHMVAFQSKGVWALVPTGNAVTPIRRIALSVTHGASSQFSTVLGEDALGQPAIYFMDPTDGPRRIDLGSQITWLGKDVNDRWLALNSSIANNVGHCFGAYDHGRKQMVWWAPDLSEAWCFNASVGELQGGEIRRGWSRWTGTMANATCACAGPANGLDRNLYGRGAIFVVLNTATWALTQLDDAATSDNGDAFQADIYSRVHVAGTIARRKRITEAYLVADPVTGVTIRQQLIRDWGLDARSTTVLLTPAGSEVKVWRRVEATDSANWLGLQVRIGDPSAVSISPWTIDAWEGLIEVTEAAQ